MESFVSSLMTYGYWGLFMLMVLEFIGLPIPGETTLTLTGTLIAVDKMRLVPAVAATTVGSVVGSAVAYVIGRYLGRKFVLQYGRPVGITPARLVKAERLFDRYKILMLMFGRYILGIRHVVPYMAGIMCISWFDFLLYTTLGSIVWALTFIYLGHTIMTYIEPILAMLVRTWYVWTVAAMVILAITWLWWRRNKGRKSPRTIESHETDADPKAD
ncbi:MAG: DedA family protein [Alicyclobacillaceae bacterium]|nr:DedA family protein [Alicyclobacillaceae bacterium]